MATPACPRAVVHIVPSLHADVAQRIDMEIPHRVVFTCVRERGHDGSHDFGLDYARLAFLTDTYTVVDGALTGLAAAIYGGADDRNDAGPAFFEKMHAGWDAMTAARDVTRAEVLALVERIAAARKASR